MRIMTILGTRPEIIRLSQVIPRLDEHAEHVLVHTGQNFDARLRDVFFDELQVRQPDHCLKVAGSLGQQLAALFTGCEELLRKEKPDRVLILGDTNSGLSAIIARRLGIPVYHMEAGNRCHDERVPEELNRRVIDQASSVMMPYTERSRQNLLREGFPGHRVFVTGNPIREVLLHEEEKIARSDVLARLHLEAGGYFLTTAHRAENVDVPERLVGLVQAFDLLQKQTRLPVIVSTHPRTRSRLRDCSLPDNPRVRYLEPFGFHDFVALQKSARCVLSDSGTVQEECAILQVPNVTLRDVTERPETVECGSAILAGTDPERILACVEIALRRPAALPAPEEYLRTNVSSTVVNILLAG